MTDSHLHDNAPAVALLPYNTRVTSRLAQRSLDELEWPLGRPERLSHGCISDLKETDHIIAYVSSRLLYMPRPGVRA
jgi:hypothetical protein